MERHACRITIHEHGQYDVIQTPETVNTMRRSDFPITPLWEFH